MSTIKLTSGREIIVVREKARKYIAVHKSCVAEGTTLEAALRNVKQMIITKELSRLTQNN